MFVSGPTFFQPFGFGPVGAFAFPAGTFVDDGDYQARRRPHGYFQEVRQQPQRRRAPTHSAHPQFHPRYTAGYPWATPGQHYHQPDVDMYYNESNDDDSASEEDCEEYVPPSHFPARAAHYATARPVSSSSSSHSRAQAGYGEPSQHFRQPQLWRRQPSPFAAQPHVCQPDPAAHAHADCCPGAQRVHMLRQQQQQQQQPFGRSFSPLQARQQAHAAAQQAHAAHAAAPAAAAAPDTGAKQARKGSRHVPVSGPRTPSPTSQQSQQQVRPAVSHPVRPSRQLTKAQAATMIQSWWRMRRLARQEAALHALMEANAQLKQVASKFEAYTAEATSSSSSSKASKQAGAPQHGFLSHKQYLELNELAMRVLLALDCTPCGVPELRAVRKRLAANAVALLDKIQASFSATVTASMEVPDSVIDDALQRLGSKTDAAQPGSSQQQQQEEKEEEAAVEDGWVPVVDVFEDCDDSAAAAAAAFDPEVVVADVDMPPAPCDAVVDMEVVTPVRVVLKVAGQSCDAGTQTD